MGKYNVSVNSADPNAPGLNLNVQVEATDIIAAIEAAAPALQKTLDAGGLTVKKG